MPRDSLKWNQYGGAVLPLWLADMDFEPAPEIVEAIVRRAGAGTLGYGLTQASLKEAIAVHVEAAYGWVIEQEWIVSLPSTVFALNMVVQSVGEPGDGVVVQTPCYPPFLSIPTVQHRRVVPAPLALQSSGDLLHYELDLQVLEEALAGNARTLVLCHPHNPAGRGFTVAELLAIAELCERHGVQVCSDEIHAPVRLAGPRHVAFASLDHPVARRAVTLLSATKAFNLGGTCVGFAVVPDQAQRRAILRSAEGLGVEANVLGLAAAEAAYRAGGPWLSRTLELLRANRDEARRRLIRLPGLRTTLPEAGYLLWIQARQTGGEASLAETLLKRCNVALSDGVKFGAEPTFARLNFACTAATLDEALSRIERGCPSFE
jgi:cystathionine beta-lyase